MAKKKRRKEKPGDRTKKYTVREIRFIMNTVLGQNGTKAAENAGYSSNGAAQTAHRLLNRNEITAEIKRQVEKTYEKRIMGPQELLGRLSDASRADIADLTNEDGTIRRLRDIPEKTRLAITSTKGVGRKREIKIESKNTAYSLIGKYHRLFVDRIEIKDDRLADRVKRARERAAKRINKS